jgi:hypothetical protein
MCYMPVTRLVLCVVRSLNRPQYIAKHVPGLASHITSDHSLELSWTRDMKSRVTEAEVMGLIRRENSDITNLSPYCMGELHFYWFVFSRSHLACM